MTHTRRRIAELYDAILFYVAAQAGCGVLCETAGEPPQPGQFKDFTEAEIRALVNYAVTSNFAPIYWTTPWSRNWPGSAPATPDDISPWQENAIRALEDAPL